VEVTSSLPAASRTLLSAWSTDISKRVMMAALASCGCSARVGRRLAGCEPLAARSWCRGYDDGAANRASSSLASVAGIDADVSRAASLVMAPVSPLRGGDAAPTAS